MPYELTKKCAPTSPHCPACAQVMRLARITSRFGDLPDLYTFECRACGVSHIEPALSTSIIDPTVGRIQERPVDAGDKPNV
jgi:hypothetical protein